MKRIRYECSTCSAEDKLEFKTGEKHPARIRCTKCGKRNGMAAMMPRPAVHFHPTKGKR